MTVQSFKAEDIQTGYHPAGYRIDKTAAPLDFYTCWQITAEGEWTESKPTCFHSLPENGWFKD